MRGAGAVIDNSGYRRAEPCGGACLARRMGADGYPRGTVAQAPAPSRDTGPGESNILDLERFRAKWIPVRVKKTRQNKNLEPRSDSIGTEKALALDITGCSVKTDARGMD